MTVKRKQILELHDFGDGFGIRAVSDITGHSRNTVRDVVAKAKELGITRQVLSCLSEKDVNDLFAMPVNDAFEPIDFEYVERELSSKGVNRKLLWVEYCEDCARKGAQPYSYSSFCTQYAGWAEKNNVTTHVVHRAGYAAQIDWAGDLGAAVVDSVTGQVAKAHFFVMTMPYSGKMYVEAFPDEKMPSWINAHVHAFSSFGGVPAILVIDNLRTGVKKPDFFEPEVNETYRQMADHYGTAIVPAKVYSPKMKGQVERTVKIVETWVIARLRHSTFYSFAELNGAVRQCVDDLNAQCVRHQSRTRDEVFAQDETEHLLPLPQTPFELAAWKQAKVQQDSHFQCESMRYSAPCAYVGQTLDVRLGEQTVSAYADGECVCTHKRLFGRMGQYSTVEAHMPKHLQASSNTLWSYEGFCSWAKKVGPATHQVTKAILDSKPIVEQAHRSCRGLKSLADSKGGLALEAACLKACSLGSAFSYTQIKNILAAQESAPVKKTNLDKLVNGSPGSKGYLRDPGDYSNNRNGEQLGKGDDRC